MVITYFGEGCFRLQSGTASCLIDPKNARLKGDVILWTSASAEEQFMRARTRQEAAEVAFAGEYEMKDWEVQGFGVNGEGSPETIQTIYLVRREGMSFLFLGHLQKALDAKFLEKAGESDVVVMPFDGDKRLSAAAADKIAKQLSPYFLISDASKAAQNALKDLVTQKKIQDKLVLKRKDLAERGKVVFLKEHNT